MRSVLIYAMAIVFFFSACKGKDKDTTTITTDNGKTTLTVDPTKTETVTNEMEKKTEELKKLAPMTLDQIKAMLPAELLGMKRSSFNANAMMGFASADADYKKDDTTNLKTYCYGLRRRSRIKFLCIKLLDKNDNGIRE